MTYKLSQQSLAKLQGVHPDLVSVVELAITMTHVDFAVLEGLRTPERQAELVAKGVSWSINSRHLTGHAVDLGAIVDGQVTWTWAPYYVLYEAMSAAAKQLKVPIEWGGNWLKRKDGPHYQLPWSKYPISSQRGITI
jgi:peptidoglycan L-alanyl-D-glutamate endopeptidase CwlK